MTPDVDDPWRNGVSITELTDRDIEDGRNTSSGVSDSTHELHRLIATIAEREGLNYSGACDRALRVELAHAIDNYDVSFDHSDFDVAYTIPPLDWIREQDFPRVELLDEDDVDTSSRAITFSMPQAVHEMVKEAVAEGAYQSITAAVMQGAKRLLGRVE